MNELVQYLCLIILLPLACLGAYLGVIIALMVLDPSPPKVTVFGVVISRKDGVNLMSEQRDILIAWLKAFDDDEKDARTAARCAAEMEAMRDEIERAHKALRDIISSRGGHSAPERMRNIAREALQTKISNPDLICETHDSGYPCQQCESEKN